MSLSPHDMTGMGMPGDSGMSGETSGDDGMSGDTSGGNNMFGGLAMDGVQYGMGDAAFSMASDGLSGDDEMGFLNGVTLVRSGRECDYFCRHADDCVAAAFREGICRLYRQDQLRVTQEKGTTLFVKRPESKWISFIT